MGGIGDPPSATSAVAALEAGIEMAPLGMGGMGDPPSATSAVAALEAGIEMTPLGMGGIGDPPSAFSTDVARRHECCEFVVNETARVTKESINNIFVDFMFPP
jgi:hypothetical protein